MNDTGIQSGGPPRARAPRAASVSLYERSSAPAVRLLDRYLQRALEAGASDIHFEPAPHGLSVRMRVDGVLCSTDKPPKSLAAALLGRIRLLSRVDLAERRLPQDGRFTLQHTAAGSIDVRAAFMPVRGGEKITLRLLQRSSRLLRIERLGLSNGEERCLRRVLSGPDGLLVVAGPTGSGKTTTLYAALAALKGPERSIITVEDPVEVEIEGVAQVPVDEEAGRGFAVALRALLRQDPDVVMVGEVRDAESAHIACRAALTGHLVLTSVHAGRTREAVMRFPDMGVPSYLFRSTARLVLAQRLLRRLCDECKQTRKLSPDDHRLFSVHGLEPPTRLAWPGGCDKCHGRGYGGRTAVFELLEDFEDLEAQGCGEIPRHSLAAAGLRKAASLDTTLSEVIAHCPLSATVSATLEAGR